MPRAHIPESTVTAVLVESRRRCALCFGLNHGTDVKPGQIAHVDRNAENNALANLAWLCLQHHDQYDSRTSQSKGLTEAELRHYRDELYAFNDAARRRLEPTGTYAQLSHGAAQLARHLNAISLNGNRFDSQSRLDALGVTTALKGVDIELAVDELRETGLVEIGGTRDYIFATDRLFWETDPLFRDSDPMMDSQTVARLIVEGPTDQPSMGDLANRLGWRPRRLNPAISYLANAGLLIATETAGCRPFRYGYLKRHVALRRFVRDLDDGAR